MSIPALVGSCVLGGCAQTRDDASQAEASDQKAPRTLDEIRASGHFNVAVYSDAAPFSYLNEKGVYDGFDHFLCLYLTELTGIGVTYVSVDPAERYQALRDRTVDLCLAEASPSDADCGDADFTNPLFSLQLCLVCAKGSKIDDMAKLKAGQLIVARGSYADQYASDTWPKVEPRRYETISETFDALEDGRGSALLTDELMAKAWLASHGEFSLAQTGIDEPRPIAIALAPGQDELHAQVQKAVDYFTIREYGNYAYRTYIRPVAGDDSYRPLFKVLV